MVLRFSFFWTFWWGGPTIRLSHSVICRPHEKACGYMPPIVLGCLNCIFSDICPTIRTRWKLYISITEFKQDRIDHRITSKVRVSRTMKWMSAQRLISNRNAWEAGSEEKMPKWTGERNFLFSGLDIIGTENALRTYSSLCICISIRFRKREFWTLHQAKDMEVSPFYNCRASNSSRSNEIIKSYVCV